MHQRKHVRVVAWCLMALFVLVGCGGKPIEPMTLERFFTEEEAGQQKLAEIEQRLEDQFLPMLGPKGEVRVSVVGNHLTYEIMYGHRVAVSLVQEALGWVLDGMVPDLERTLDELKTAADLQTHLKLTVKYVDIEGELLASKVVSTDPLFSSAAESAPSNSAGEETSDAAKSSADAPSQNTTSVQPS